MIDPQSLLLTFEQIEKAKGITLDQAEDKYPLEIWYALVRKKPLKEFSVDDICIACRQDIFPEYVVPLAIEVLENDPQAGPKYDGELLVALNSIEKSFWTFHASERLALKSFVERRMDKYDEDIQEDAKQLLLSLQ